MKDDHLRDELTTLVTDLIRFSSTANQPDQITAVMEYVRHYLGSFPALHHHYSESNSKPSLVVTLRDTRSPTLMLNGHLDVIPASSEQFEPQIRDNRIYGRASQDMKGSVAVMLRLLKDLAELAPPPDVGVQFVCDEETGGEDGTGRLVAEGWHCGLFIATEPTDLRICYEQKGILWLKVNLYGNSAHGSRPWEGQNPLSAMTSGLHMLEQHYPSPTYETWCTTVTPTSVYTDSRAVNQIPHHVTLKFDIRYIPQDDPDQILANVRQCFPDAQIHMVKRADPLATNPDLPLVQQLVTSASRVQGQPATLYREHFGSDARFYSARDIPALCLGPVGAGMHSTEEWVDIESLLQLYHILWDYTTHLGEVSDGP